MDDGAGDGDTLTFASGEEVGAVIGARGEADIIERGGYATAALGG